MLAHDDRSSSRHEIPNGNCDWYILVLHCNTYVLSAMWTVTGRRSKSLCTGYQFSESNSHSSNSSTHGTRRQHTSAKRLGLGSKPCLPKWNKEPRCQIVPTMPVYLFRHLRRLIRDCEESVYRTGSARVNMYFVRFDEKRLVIVQLFIALCEMYLCGQDTNPLGTRRGEGKPMCSSLALVLGDTSTDVK